MKSRLNWYWNRLRLMGLAEITWRASQVVQKKAATFGIGLAMRPPLPVWPQASRTFTIFEGLDSPTPDSAGLVHAAESLLGGRWQVFALRDAELGFPPEWNRDPRTGTRAPMRLGKAINYRDEALVGDIKYLWEPSRHLELLTLCLAYKATGESRFQDGAMRLLTSWLDQCPYPRGVHWTSSLELAIRLLNWSLAWQVLGGRSAEMWQSQQGQALLARWMTAIYQHQHFIQGYLSRHSSANNHLFGEYMGLYVGALTWPCWKASSNWLLLAEQGLEHEAIAQNHGDGVNKEQAVYYHHEVMDMMLLCTLYGRAAGRPLSAAFEHRLEHMAEFLAAMMDCAGNVPMIGDADDAQMARMAYEQDFSIYRSLLASCGQLFSNSAWQSKGGSLDSKTTRLLGAARSTDTVPTPVRSAFPEGGYWLMGADWETPSEVRAVLDAGDLGYLSIAAHGHADALAMVLSVGGHELLVDPGTYAYHTQKIWRDHFRSTAAHNTVEVDGLDQSVIAGNFMWLDKANARLLSHDLAHRVQVFEAEHDGYKRLSDPVVHRRRVIFDSETRGFEITDTLTCNGNHHVRIHWHFHEDLQPILKAHELHVDVDAWHATMSLDNPAFSVVVVKGQADPPQGWLSRRFDERVPAAVACWSGDISGTTTLVTRLNLRSRKSGMNSNF